MKNKYYFLYFVMLLSLAIALVAMYVFPDIIPLQYDDSGVYRFGSKYELLAITALFMFIETGFVIAGKHESKKGNCGTNEKPLIYSCIAVSIFWLAAEIYFIYLTYSYWKLNKIAFNIDTLSFFVCICLGIMFCVAGNILPKTTKDSLIGVHIMFSKIWDASRGDTWKKTQRFSGIVFVVCGIIIILCALIFKSYIIRLILTGISIIMAVCIIYVASICIFRKNTGQM